MKSEHIDPRFVQISKAEAAKVLGISVPEFDRRRKNDAKCPKGFKENAEDQFSRVRFRLSDIYEYSEYLMSKSVPAISA